MIQTNPECEIIILFPEKQWEVVESSEITNIDKDNITLISNMDKIKIELKSK